MHRPKKDPSPSPPHPLRFPPHTNIRQNNHFSSSGMAFKDASNASLTNSVMASSFFT